MHARLDATTDTSLERDRLRTRIRGLLVEVMALEIDPADIDGDEPLLRERINLDSVGSVQLFVSLEAEFGITIKTETVTRQTLQSVETLACFIEESRAVGDEGERNVAATRQMTGIGDKRGEPGRRAAVARSLSGSETERRR